MWVLDCGNRLLNPFANGNRISDNSDTSASLSLSGLCGAITTPNVFSFVFFAMNSEFNLADAIFRSEKEKLARQKQGAPSVDGNKTQKKITTAALGSAEQSQQNCQKPTQKITNSGSQKRKAGAELDKPAAKVKRMIAEREPEVEEVVVNRLRHDQMMKTIMGLLHSNLTLKMS